MPDELRHNDCATSFFKKSLGSSYSVAEALCCTAIVLCSHMVRGRLVSAPWEAALQSLQCSVTAATAATIAAIYCNDCRADGDLSRQHTMLTQCRRHLGSHWPSTNIHSTLSSTTIQWWLKMAGTRLPQRLLHGCHNAQPSGALHEGTSEFL